MARTYVDKAATALMAAGLMGPPNRVIRPISRWSPECEKLVAKDRKKQKRRAKNKAARKARKAGRS